MKPVAADAERRHAALEPAAMQSAVQCALLGLVIERPSYGYELARRFEHTYGELLRLSAPSYVYTALDALRRRGLVEAIAATGPARLPKPHYRATADGRRAFHEHLLAQLLATERRRRLFFREFAVLAHEPLAALEIIDHYEREYLLEAKRAPVAVERGARRAGAITSSAPAALAAELAAEERRLAIDATLAWLDHARRTLQALAQSDHRRRDPGLS